jgi:rfaE bifunctional protein kinase chain/domain
VSARPRTDEAALAARLLGIVAGFRGRRVVVLGDLVADEFLYGDIARVSREAPVLILEHHRTISAPGGGGNAVANLAALGAHPVPVGIVGRDESGKRLTEALARGGVSTRTILAAEGYETPSKCRVLAGGVHTRRQQIVRIDRGARHGELGAATRRELRRRLSAALAGAEALLVADYGYGAASPAALEGLLGKQLSRGLVVTVDSRTRVAEYRGVTACTPNQEELERALGLASAVADDELPECGRRLLRRSGNRSVLVTRGAKGMLLFERGRPPLAIPAWGSDEVADVTGAGDTVIAAFTLALLGGADGADAARIANYAAGVVVRKSGTATTTPAELGAAIREDLA